MRRLHHFHLAVVKRLNQSLNAPCTVECCHHTRPNLDSSAPVKMLSPTLLETVLDKNKELESYLLKL